MVSVADWPRDVSGKTYQVAYAVSSRVAERSNCCVDSAVRGVVDADQIAGRPAPPSGVDSRGDRRWSTGRSH